MRRAAATILAGAVLGVAAARADDATYGGLAPFQLVQEVRGGVYGDDAVHREQTAPMATIEALTSPLLFYPSANPWIAAALDPRFEAGAMINTYGLTSYGFAGLNWRTPQWGPLFLEVGLGGAVNDSTDNPKNLRRTDLGCPVTFRESAGLGWRISEHFDIVGGIEHISNANLCGRINPGLTSVGIRLGYRF